tara:strand:+ start:225 stop:2186 length:1962 start_codon:yes stop_codon:yes gene_type:complete
MVSLEEQLLLNSFKKVFLGAGNLSKPVDITQVFSTFVHTGTGQSQAIDNGINLGGEGGLVWIKKRNATKDHGLMDTVQGLDGSSNSRYLKSNTTAATATGGLITAYNSDGFTLGTADISNGNNNSYVSWTFRKAKKFFDVVTYTGNNDPDNSGTSQNIAHNLGSAPGMIIVKRTDDAAAWYVFHRGVNGGTNPENYGMLLSDTQAQVDEPYFGDTLPTSSVFTVGPSAGLNGLNFEYVAYVFAHNNNDGEFGPDGDQDIIKCGYYTANNGTQEINVGFEPQWILVKCTSNATDWKIIDNMRRFAVDTNNKWLTPNTSNAEENINASTSTIEPTATGFRLTNGDAETNADSRKYIYVAIRRGQLALPEAATEVFEVALRTNVLPSFKAPFTVDMGWVRKGTNTGGGIYNPSRLTGTKFLYTSGIDAEANDNGFVFDFMNGFANDGGASSTIISWMWKRAPGYFDVVCYTGTGSARTIAHNLGVVPEMIWIKKRDAERAWKIYHSGTGNGKAFEFNTEVAATSAAFWNDTTPTASVFSVRNTDTVNGNNNTFVAHLFATLDGISKVGSVSHSGTTNVDCGFTSGARFVMLKRTDAASDWYLWDSVRGIVTGNDPYLLINTNGAEVTNTDFIDPLNAGFTIADDLTDGDYIFYAVA